MNSIKLVLVHVIYMIVIVEESIDEKTVLILIVRISIVAGDGTYIVQLVVSLAIEVLEVLLSLRSRSGLLIARNEIDLISFRLVLSIAE